MKYLVRLLQRRSRYEETHRIVEAPEGVDRQKLADALYDADPDDEHMTWDECGDLEVEAVPDGHSVSEAPDFLLSSTKVDENYKVEFTR